MPDPQYDLGRITLPLDLRARSRTAATIASRLAGALDIGWSTDQKLADCEEHALEAAKEMLALHTMIAGQRRAAAQRAAAERVGSDL